MGICSSSSSTPVYPTTEKASSKQTNAAIDQQLMMQMEEEKRVIKILLLGAGECGKSTILKQMRILHLNGFNSPEEKAYFKGLIMKNTLESIQTLCAAVEQLSIGFDSIENKRRAEDITKINYTNGEMPLDFSVKEDIKELWQRDKGILAAFDRQNEFHLLDSASYFLNEIDRIFAVDFVPQEQDILRSRVSTTGIIETQFTIDKLTFKMYDVGGQRGERKKWIHCFDNVTAIMFIASLSEYDQVLAEDRARNRLKESLDLFEGIINLPWFKDAPIILFLNKDDIFKSKIAKVDIGIYFPHYTGGCDYGVGLKFIQDSYFERNRNPLKTIYCVSEGSPVDLSNGVSLPIESLQQNQVPLWSYAAEERDMETRSSKATHGVLPSTQSAWMNNGVRECVELTMEDGRTISCTPDHRILVVDCQTGERVWKPAAEIKVSTYDFNKHMHCAADRVLIGPTNPLMRATAEDRKWQPHFADRFDYSFDQWLAISRMLGLLMTDGRYTADRLKVVVGHKLDCQQFNFDYRSVFGSELLFKLDDRSHLEGGSSVFEAAVPVSSPLNTIYLVCGQLAGDRMTQVSRVPNYMMNEAGDIIAPRAIVVEFLAGLWAGHGAAPDITRNGNTLAVDCELQFTQCKEATDPQVAAQHEQYLHNIRSLLVHVGISEKEVAIRAESLNRRRKFTSKQEEYRAIILSVDGFVQFGQLVGYRYSVHKLARLGPILAYTKLKEAANSQFHEASGEYNTALPELGEWLMKVNAWSIYCDIPLQQFLAMKEARDYHHDAVPRGQKEFPVFELAVVGRRDAGLKRVYDISMANSARPSFLVNGVAVHNCHVTNATNTENIAFVWKCTKHIILEQNLTRSGLLMV